MEPGGSFQSPHLVLTKKEKQKGSVRMLHLCPVIKVLCKCSAPQSPRLCWESFLDGTERLGFIYYASAMGGSLPLSSIALGKAVQILTVLMQIPEDISCRYSGPAQPDAKRFPLLYSFLAPLFCCVLLLLHSVCNKQVSMTNSRIDACLVSCDFPFFCTFFHFCATDGHGPLLVKHCKKTSCYGFIDKTLQKSIFTEGEAGLVGSRCQQQTQVLLQALTRNVSKGALLCFLLLISCHHVWRAVHRREGRSLPQGAYKGETRELAEEGGKQCQVSGEEYTRILVHVVSCSSGGE